MSRQTGVVRCSVLCGDCQRTFERILEPHESLDLCCWWAATICLKALDLCTWRRLSFKYPGKHAMVFWGIAKTGRNNSSLDTVEILDSKLVKLSSTYMGDFKPGAHLVGSADHFRKTVEVAFGILRVRDAANA